MIKEKELTKFKQIKFRDGDRVSFDKIKSAVKSCAGAFRVPIAFDIDYIKSGSIIGSTTTDCLILYHPSYREKYNYYAITIARQGTYAFVDILRGGSSAQGMLMDAKNVIKGGSFSSLTDFGKGQVVGTVIGAAIKGNLFKNNTNAYNEEQNWYVMIEDAIEDAFNGGQLR